MELETARNEVIAAGKRLAANGLIIGSSGNLSVREGDRVVVTPSGMALDAVQPEDLAVIDMDGNWLTGQRKPTSEVQLHLAIYQHSPEACAITHTHAVGSTAVSCTCSVLPPIHYTNLYLGGAVHVAKYATYGSKQLAENVVTALAKGTSAALMANHGSIAYGNTMAQACERLELLEWLCDVYRACIPLGQPRVLTPEELTDVMRMYRSDRYASGPQQAN
ncbi:class II aldolase/adducin family protein [Rhodanobacter sp. A1T4]|uniref:class II aldolase/adducin family protein n=1 Tax=Rhodanobacter sp. A1T4 TaxID=2723087 RepID=UPI00161DC24D|nr:class II aldolase/adducin family protein [Rhodanobacter sp. A1T4]MBB6247212.1 L-fuculose-phosphate aldolase [Rhodanobacter sp. A1T4]